MGYTFPGERVDLGGGRGWLDRPHADSIFRIDRQIGHRLQITEAGRSWDEQNAHFQTFLRVGYPIALSPDAPSVHQKGGAIDSNEAQRILQIMEDHGWRRTVYRWVNGRWTLVEEWHFERFENLDNHRNEPAPAGGNATPIQEDDMYDDAAENRINARFETLERRTLDIIRALNGETIPDSTDLRGIARLVRRSDEGRILENDGRSLDIVRALNGESIPGTNGEKRAIAKFLSGQGIAPADVDEEAIVRGVLAGLAQNQSMLIDAIRALPQETIAALKSAL